MQEIYLLLGTRPLSQVVQLLLDAIQYDAYLREDKKENYDTRAEIVSELITYIAEFTQGIDESQVDALQAFLENVALFSQADNVDEQNGCVSLMTLHSAKGLEFPVVFLAGLEDGLFPSQQSRYDGDKLEEERRLCYVGITRAMEELHLSYARQRMIYGRINESLPSLFLQELAPILPEKEKPASTRPAAKSRFSAEAEEKDMHMLKPRSVTPGGVPRFDLSGGNVQPKQSVTPGSALTDLAPGARIRHKSFGDGTVLSVTGGGSAQIVEIAFDAGQNKKFAAAYAPIEKIS